MNSVVLYKACSFEIPERVLREISGQKSVVIVTTPQRKKKWEMMNRGFIVILYQNYRNSIGKLPGTALVFDEFYLIHRYILGDVSNISILFETTSRFESVTFISSKGLITNVNLLQNAMSLTSGNRQQAMVPPETPQTETLVETERKHPFHIGIGVAYFMQVFVYIDLFILAIMAFVEFAEMTKLLVTGNWHDLGTATIVEVAILLSIGLEYMWLYVLEYIRKLFLIRLNRASNKQIAERHAAAIAASGGTSRKLLVLFNSDEKYKMPRIKWAPATPLQIYLSMELMRNKKLDQKTKKAIGKFREGEFIENLFDSHSDFKNCEDGCVIGNIPSKIKDGDVQYPHKYYAILCDIFGLPESSFAKIMELSVVGKIDKITEMFKKGPRPKRCHVISRFSIESFSKCLDVHGIKYEMVGDEELIVIGELNSSNRIDIHCLEIFPNMNERDHIVDCFRTNNYIEWGIDFSNTVDQLKKVREKVPQSKVSHFDEDIDFLISIDHMNIEQQQLDYSVSSDYINRALS